MQQGGDYDEIGVVYDEISTSFIINKYNKIWRVFFYIEKIIIKNSQKICSIIFAFLYYKWTDCKSKK